MSTRRHGRHHGRHRHGIHAEDVAPAPPAAADSTVDQDTDDAAEERDDND